MTSGQPAVIYGTDYATPDGTCIRDYVHVADVADAHVRVARALEDGTPCADVYNVGRGAGSSVREIVDAVHAVTGIDFEISEQPRRPGDPARIVGSAQRIAADLAWFAVHDLTDMVSSAWDAWNYQLATYGGAPGSFAVGAVGPKSAR